MGHQNIANCWCKISAFVGISTPSFICAWLALFSTVGSCTQRANESRNLLNWSFLCIAQPQFHVCWHPERHLWVSLFFLGRNRIFLLSTVKNAIILVFQLDYYKRCTLLAWKIKMHDQLMSTRQQYICGVVPLPSLKQAWGVIKIGMFVVARTADSTHRFDACPIWSSEASTHFCTPPTHRMPRSI